MRVRVEHLDQPIGIGDRRPRLSWQLPADAREQVAYELRLSDGPTTGRVESPENVLVPWPSADLGSRERRQVRVRVWTDRGETPWSEPTTVEAGLLAPADWASSWVAPAQDGLHRPGFRPAHLVRGGVRIDRPVAAARLYLTAHGIYEPYLNGRRVGDLELAPGFTAGRR
jgi:alpha-L-rhamnosidase